MGGRQELGQNFLVDRRVIDRMVALVDAAPGPVVELGAGGGALTRPLAALGRPLTAVELDPQRADALRRDLAGSARIVRADAVTWRHPSQPHVVVGNVPFHLTTAILRKLLAEPSWSVAVLLTQWEAARRRCGVGGTSQLTVQWMPWFEFRLDRRVPARAFRPMPSVDGGLFTITRRECALVPDADRRAYQSWVGEVFGGRGRGLAQVLARTGHPLPVARARAWLVSRGLPADVLPGRLTADDWGALWAEVRRRR
ncbi:23S ribosomal RNA methyltransferase Erm [Agromyces sp. CFH 90414]|uniref:23S ribosomal RNA methyltransferase Erm n=1 Tax=Agromyces agglutinans TaxID=2662258 RepID=A0A6I2F981_9MICO|nr:23S ribosomal RNA methyltransferase Erm [Agromyces agglutinans]MRG59270.1 23S ribosomal RNA methyltransferase Erm [Agromyces agglutinans]